MEVPKFKSRSEARPGCYPVIGQCQAARPALSWFEEERRDGRPLVIIRRRGPGPPAPRGHGARPRLRGPPQIIFIIISLLSNQGQVIHRSCHGSGSLYRRRSDHWLSLAGQLVSHRLPLPVGFMGGKCDERPSSWK
eukprot:720319-Hanusia_phi.AAC.1